MAKGLPVIQNFDGLLMLLNEPEKAAAFLNEIKAYRDEIKANLDIAVNLEQARRILQEAADKRAAAQQYEAASRAALDAEQKKVREELTLARATLDAELASSHASLTLFKREKKDFDEWRTVVERDIADHRSSLNAKEQELSARESALSSREQEMDARRKKLEAALR